MDHFQGFRDLTPFLQVMDDTAYRRFRDRLYASLLTGSCQSGSDGGLIHSGMSQAILQNKVLNKSGYLSFAFI